MEVLSKEERDKRIKEIDEQIAKLKEEQRALRRGGYYDPNKSRNEEIFDAIAQGIDIEQISANYQVSRARIGQIFAKESRKRRHPARHLRSLQSPMELYVYNLSTLRALQSIGCKTIGDVCEILQSQTRVTGMGEVLRTELVERFVSYGFITPGEAEHEPR